MHRWGKGFVVLVYAQGPAPPAAAIGRVPGMLAVATIGLLAGVLPDLLSNPEASRSPDSSFVIRTKKLRYN